VAEVEIKPLIGHYGGFAETAGKEGEPARFAVEIGAENAPQLDVGEGEANAISVKMITVKALLLASIEKLQVTLIEAGRSGIDRPGPNMHLPGSY
jgi:hypothetical protein